MPWYVTVYELLLQVSLAGCVLLALATIAVLLLREPARKIRVIELAMLGLLALPLVTLIPGYPRVALLPATSRANEERVIANVKKNPPAKPGANREVTSSSQPPALPGGRATMDPVTQSAPRVSPAPLARTVTQRESPAIAAPTRTWQLPSDFRFWVVLAYLSGVGILLLWSLVGLVAMRRLIRSSHPADDGTRAVLHAIAGEASARVRLLVSSRAAQPCACGWLRPTIVLPQSLVTSGDSASLRFALAHEWSHVSRGDIGVWSLSTLARLLHFQQPLLWLLRQHLRRSQDYLADAAAAGAGTPEDYAEFLTSLSQHFKRPHIASGLGIVSRHSDLHRRVVMLVEKQGSLERIPPKRWNAGILIAGLLAVAFVASLRAESDPISAPNEQIQPKAKQVAEPAPNTDEVPTELQPEHIRDTARRYAAGDIAVHNDPVLRELKARLNEVLREQSDVSLDSITTPGTSEPHYRLPMDPRQVRFHSLQVKIQQREAELRGLAWSKVNEPRFQIDLRRRIENDREYKQLVQSLTSVLADRRTLKAQEPTPATVNKLKLLNEIVLELEQQIQTRSAQVRSQVFDMLAALAESQPESTTRSPSEPPQIRRAPFSGKIRPGDILNIDIRGGLPNAEVPPRTVEPDGNVALVAAYGNGRITVAGKTLTEAGKVIEEHLREMLRDPSVLVTYAGHDPDVIAEGEATATTSATPAPAADPILLAPLDTIEVHLPVKWQMQRTSVDGKLREVLNTPQNIDDVYVIEPDGNIALPFRYGRVNIKGVTEEDAGNAIRKHLTAQWMPRTTLPQVSVRKRGRALLPADKLPTADYCIRPGDSLLIGNGLQSAAFNYQVTAEGNLPDKEIAFFGATPDQGGTVPPLHVAGLSLAEAQEAIATTRKGDAIIVTIGGWHEEAGPDVIMDGEAAATSPTLPTSKPIVLAPLDTIEVRLGAKSSYLDSANGTYLIEPDGRINLFDGRLTLAGLTELEAGNAIRTFFSQRPWQRKAPPSINVVRRGRAVFPDGKQPPAEYRVRAGDLLLVNQIFSATDGGSYEVAADGSFQTLPDQVAPKQEAVHVAGLTLEEVQKLLRERWKTFNFPGGGGALMKTELHKQPWMVTIGGWHEEADPALIDRLEESTDPRVQQLERELQEIKSMTHAQPR